MAADAGFSVKEAAVLAEVSEKSTRHELARDIATPARQRVGEAVRRRLYEHDIFYLNLIAALPVSLSVADRRDLYAMIAGKLRAKGRWRRTADRLEADRGGVRGDRCCRAAQAIGRAPAPLPPGSSAARRPLRSRRRGPGIQGDPGAGAPHRRADQEGRAGRGDPRRLSGIGSGRHRVRPALRRASARSRPAAQAAGLRAHRVIRLLIDEHLSPRLALRLADRTSAWRRAPVAPLLGLRRALLGWRSSKMPEIRAISCGSFCAAWLMSRYSATVIPSVCSIAATSSPLAWSRSSAASVSLAAPRMRGVHCSISWLTVNAALTNDSSFAWSYGSSARTAPPAAASDNARTMAPQVRLTIEITGRSFQKMRFDHANTTHGATIPRRLRSAPISTARRLPRSSRKKVLRQRKKVVSKDGVSQHRTGVSAMDVRGSAVGAGALARPDVAASAGCGGLGSASWTRRGSCFSMRPRPPPPWRAATAARRSASAWSPPCRMVTGGPRPSSPACGRSGSSR